jgi:hypothetical protein
MPWMMRMSRSVQLFSDDPIAVGLNRRPGKL